MHRTYYTDVVKNCLVTAQKAALAWDNACCDSCIPWTKFHRRERVPFKVAVSVALWELNHNCVGVLPRAVVGYFSRATRYQYLAGVFWLVTRDRTESATGVELAILGRYSIGRVDHECYSTGTYYLVPLTAGHHLTLALTRDRAVVAPPPI